MTAPPGWYADPNYPATWRWWDGAQWTTQTGPVQTGRDWRIWITTSRSAGRIGLVIATLAIFVAAVVCAIIVLDLVRQRPVGGAANLLIIGVPLVAVGQLWAVGLMQARQPSGTGQRNGRYRRGSIARAGGVRKVMFGSLSPGVARGLMTLAFLGWLAAITAVPWTFNGNRADPGNGCAYRLESHGAYSCVSHHAYEQAGAGVQRFAAGILLGFASLQAGAALGGLAARRRSAD